MKELPASVGRLQALQARPERLLDLTSLPAEVGSCVKLKLLNMDGCKGLTSLPAEVGRLQALQRLNLTNCSRLTSLPAEVGNCVKLESLVLRAARA